MIIRKKTKKIFVGGVAIGGDAPITIQSMTNTDTKDIEATVKQVIDMENHGLDIIRMAVNDEEDAKAINEILSWLEEGPNMTRNQVIESLDKLGLDTEKKLPGKREGLADIIKYTYLNQATWNLADTLYVTIGQGDSAYTPIQMSNYVACTARQ